MKRLIILLVLFVIALYSRAQGVNILPPAAQSQDSAGHPGTQSSAVNKLKKPDFHVSLGMDFSTASGYGSGFTQYVIPSVSFPVGKKLILSGGIAVANTKYFNARPFYSGELFSPYNGNYTSLTVFANGTYFINEKLTISGTFYKEIPVSGQKLSYSPYNPISQQGSQGFNVNVQYQLGKHVFLQAGFEINQGYNPRYINPFAPSVYHGLDNMNFGGVPQSLYNIFSP